MSSVTTNAPSSIAHSRIAVAPQAAVVRVGAVLVGVGLAFVVLALDAPPAMAWLYRLLAADDTETTMNAAAQFGAALFGALTFGWGVTILQLGRGRDVPSAITTGTIAWFIVDSAASVVVGYPGNVVLNVGTAGLVLALLRPGRR